MIKKRRIDQNYSAIFFCLLSFHVFQKLRAPESRLEEEAELIKLKLKSKNGYSFYEYNRYMIPPHSRFD